MRVINDITVKVQDVFANPDLIGMAEQNIDFNLRAGNFTNIMVDPATAYVYQGNFYGLLSKLGIDPNYHAFTAYVNGLKSPYDYDGVTYSIKIVDNSIIDNIARLIF